jgi:hypothetical protein
MASPASERDLNEPCGACTRPVGDHTVRERLACSGHLTTDLPYEDVAPDLAAAATENIRASFGSDGDVIVADHIVARALTFDGHAGPVRLVYPGVLHEFAVGVPGQPPAVVAKVLFMGSEESVRAYGRLLRDTSNGAVNAAGRARA